MKIKEGFKLRAVGNEYIVSGEGLQQINFNKLISLNSSAAYLWQQIESKEFNKQTLADLLTTKYNISDEQALADATDVANNWIEAGIVEK
ncbi:MAG: PqqD family protein [Dysgonomonas sp.]